MARTLDFDLNSQSKISQEGTLPETKKAIPVGQRAIDFSVPDYGSDLRDDIAAQNTPQAQKMVDKINQYIENIADDYFLLGVHLIALHRLLKQSKIGTEQIKTWYAENINMPYSSAMQCKKVAEVYADNPELINRYTASGAYLLSSYKNHEERESIWIEACQGKATASIRNLRSALKKRQELERSSRIEDKAEVLQYKMAESEIYAGFVQLSEEARRLQECENPMHCVAQRKQLIEMTRDLIRQMEALV